MTGTLTELGRLHLSRPAATASPEAVAAWKRRRAAAREHLAAEQRHASAGTARTGAGR
ncbi:hypothetical protein ACFXPA_44165 [Amycolatopsis sp. NPDC059090]|uniref:hypothetical protein n=1 Tax=unclassified Amycolatopsis TaxID=2618356 RepID=UPI00366EA695